MICTPSHDGKVSQIFTMSLVQTALSIGKEAILWLSFLGNDAAIGRARSTLVAGFLDNPNFTHLMFIDSDIGWDPKQFVRLLRANKEFVAAFYPVKSYDWALARDGNSADPLERRGLHYVGVPCEGAELEREGEFITARFSGGGFQLIARSVFEKMCLAYPELKFLFTHVRGQSPSENRYAFFEGMIEDGYYLSEDFAFCKRWRAIGGKIWLDTKSKLIHSGSHDFYGDVAQRYELCR